MNSPTKNSKATRSSLACLPCRSRHLKCDGKRPCCSRCAEAAQECNYARSRRGGLDRAALAERRKRLAANSSGSAKESQTAVAIADDWAYNGVPNVQAELDLSLEAIDTNFSGAGLLDGISVDESSQSPASVHVHMASIENDALIDSYYKNFHRFHPFVLPKRHMTRHYRDPSRQPGLQPLIAAMRMVGHIYARREWSTELKNHIETCCAQASPSDPIIIQARLLYSIALFWYDQKNQAKTESDNAIKLALNLQVSREEFAIQYGGGDSVLAESWRRTWWMLYIIDAYYAGTLGTMEMRAVDVNATVKLPCEEDEYESGVIPEPKSVQDFDCREFSSDDIVFSSFAYLIGAVRCAALAIATVPKRAAKEDSMHIIQAADSALDGWLLLLPKGQKQVMSKTGEIDELMFQAHLLIHVATVGIHRPLSDLKFNPVEDISSCAREPPPDTPTPDLINVHTARVMRSIEAQIRLLALPVRPFRHTPFTTCMVSEGTLALLSACHFYLKGPKLAIARDQIRMTIGCLKALGEIWPRTARNVREIQTIAQHVLGVGSRGTSTGTGSTTTPGSSDLPRLVGGADDGRGSGSGSGSLGSSEGGDPDLSSTETDPVSLLGSIDDLCGWYNLAGDLSTDLPWEMVNGL
ncbi:C6 zinc finger domain protein, partial [Aspergillus germanicus]